MILQIFFKNKLFAAAFFFCCYFSFIIILKISLAVVLLYFLNKTNKKRFLIVSGSHHSTPLVETDTKSKNKQRRCKVCKKKTCYKCGKCSKPGQPLVLCKEGREIALQNFTVNVSMICQVIIHSKNCNSPE